jgi:hypothetical protein
MGGVNGSQSYLEYMGLGHMENGKAIVAGLFSLFSLHVYI